jgi:hypothetical protein
MHVTTAFILILVLKALSCNHSSCHCSSY